MSIRRFFKRYFRLIFCLLGFGSFVVSAFSQTNNVPQTSQEEEQLIHIKADRWNYNQHTEIVELQGHVILTHPTSRLTADRVNYNRETGEAVAIGNVHLYRGDEHITADSLFYNFKTKEVSVAEYRGIQSPWLIGGHHVGRELSSTREDRFELNNAFVTTSDYEKPYYRFYAQRLTVYPKQKIVAHNVVTYIGDVPVFYLPYLSKRVDDATPSFSIVPGYSSDHGGYVLTAYNWTANDNLKGTVKADYRIKRGVGGGLDFDYGFDDKGGGILETYYINDANPEENAIRNSLGEKESVDGDRYRIHWKNKVEVLQDLTFRTDFTRMSDRYVEEDFFKDQFSDRIEPDNFADLTYYNPNYTASLLNRSELNDFFNSTEREPDLQLAVKRQRISDSPFFYESESSAVRLNQHFDDFLVPGRDDYNTFRLDTFHQVTSPQMLFGWLSVVPRVGGRGTYYSKTYDAFGDEDGEELRGIFNTGVEFFTKISRTWDYKNERWGIDGLRHVMEPSINYNWVPRPNVRLEENYQWDGTNFTTRLLPLEFPEFNQIDAIDENHAIRFSYRNKLETRRNGNTFNLVDWVVYTDWRIERARRQDYLSDIYSELAFNPIHWLRLRSDLRFDWEEKRLDEINDEIRFIFNPKWEFAVGNRYLREDSNLYYTQLDYFISHNWSWHMQHRFDADDGRLERQEYALTRDWHDWTTQFAFRISEDSDGTEEYAFWLLMTLKAFPQHSLSIGR